MSTRLHLVPRKKCTELYLHVATRLNSVMHNQARGTPLSIFFDHLREHLNLSTSLWNLALEAITSLPKDLCNRNVVLCDVWLTVHRSSMWNKKPTRCHLVLYLFLLYKLLNMFRATLCPSSGADDLVVFLPRVV